MLTFTKDDNNTYIVTANEKFIGRLEKEDGVWYFVYNDNLQGDVCVLYEATLDETIDELQDEFETWLKDVTTDNFGELSHTEYEE